jgi:hypothetical protein
MVFQLAALDFYPAFPEGKSAAFSKNPERQSPVFPCGEFQFFRHSPAISPIFFQGFCSMKFGCFIRRLCGTGWELCHFVPNSILPKVLATSGLRKYALGVSLLALQQKAENMKGKNANTWLTLRVTEEEKARLKNLAGIVGISVSEYMRRRFFGGRPLVPRTDECTVRELRRLGGLLKHNFVTLRDTGAGKEIIRQQENVLRQLAAKIDALGRSNDDRQEDQEQENFEAEG